MASHKEYLDYILEQLSETEGVSYRPMMGEYVLYCHGRVFGGIYDDRFLVKPTRSAAAMLPDAERQSPYPGGREMLLVDELEDPAFLRALVAAMEPELPAPKR